MSYVAMGRRGQASLYPTLKERLERSGRVEVIWDRRRAGGAAKDRASKCPRGTWSALGFVVVQVQPTGLE